MNNKNRSLLLPPGVIRIKPRVVCPNKSRVIITRLNKNSSNLSTPGFVYPPAVARRSTDGRMIIKPQHVVPKRIVRTIRREHLSGSIGEIHGEGFVNQPGPSRNWDDAIGSSSSSHNIEGLLGSNQQEPLLLTEEPHNLLEDWETTIAEGEFNPDSVLVGNENQPLYITREKETDGEYILLTENPSEAMMESSQITKGIYQTDTNEERSTTKENDGKNHEKGNSRTDHPSKAIVESAASFVESITFTPKSTCTTTVNSSTIESLEEFSSETEMTNLDTSELEDNSTSGDNSGGVERLISGNGPIGWPADYWSYSIAELKTENMEMGSPLAARTQGTPLWLTTHLRTKRPRESDVFQAAAADCGAHSASSPHSLTARISIKRAKLSPEKPAMVIDCQEYLSEVIVESTPSNEERQGDVNQVETSDQLEEAAGGSNAKPERLLAGKKGTSSSSSTNLELGTNSEISLMERLLEVSDKRAKGEKITRNISSKKMPEGKEDDLFDTLTGLKRKGVRYPLLIKCPAPRCNKFGPNFAIDNHYMMVHANTAIVDETPYIKFLRNTNK